MVAVTDLDTVVDREASRLLLVSGHVEQASATNHPLPDDAAAAFVTDPPYYDAVPYAYLSDFFYVWMRRTLADVHPSLFREGGVPKDAEIVVDRPHQLSKSTKDIAFYERELTKAFAEGRRVLAPSGVGTIVFASKTTASWEAILKAVIDAGFIITGSWPIDTEMETRVAAQGQARLAASACTSGLPSTRERRWLGGRTRSATGAMCCTNCPAVSTNGCRDSPRKASSARTRSSPVSARLLEVFSRYSRVEKANGEAVSLRSIWSTSGPPSPTRPSPLIFQDADTGGLEARRPPDRHVALDLVHRLSETARSGRAEARRTTAKMRMKTTIGEIPRPAASRGSALEFDAARKIAQGLGADSKSLAVVEVS